MRSRQTVCTRAGPKCPLFLVVVLGLLVAAAAAQPVSTKTLLAEMANLAGMAEFPDPPYTCKQFSSYDRASTSPADEKTWFANADAGQFLATEDHAGRKEYVLMDAAGPGAIVRIWSANPKGTLRIYLDGDDPDRAREGAAEPTFAAPMADLLGGKLLGIPSPIACERSMGWNSYFPIPYAQHCKVTCDERDFYYHVNYRTYPPGTAVETFAPAQFEALAADIYAVAAKLAFPRSGGAPRSSGKPIQRTFEVPPSAASSVDLDGPGAITAIEARVDAPDVTAALRNVVFLADFDGEQTIDVPLGDFFGATPGINPYEGLPLGVTASGEMWSHWIMPYERSLRIGFRNLGDQPVSIRARFETGSYRWTERSLHFSAGWRCARDVPTRPMQDWNYVTVNGQGVFAGAAFAIANPVKQWWGEGDEKIYVDGAEFPSHFGTGTEDYYGYAWCCNIPFSHAYHAQPRCDGPANYGHTAVNRWHIMDRIPFEREFRFDMELWHWHDKIQIPSLSVVSYWYARPGAKSNRQAIQPADLPLTLLPKYVPPRVAGTLEGEELRILEQTGQPGPQALEACSNEQQLWWRGAKPGDRLVLSVPVAADGKYRLLARCVTAGDYGIVQFSLNDQKAGSPIDLYHNGIAVTDELELGEFDLPAGESRLAVEVVGTNEKAKKDYMFGLDYIRLEPVP
jgi:hypothetical protein